jgi:16S rRNA (cytidine1402-2'-O)-methyltransferase
MDADSGAQKARPGTLILVATPIGNLEDISLRALRTLKEVDILAAEDTRRTRKLLTHYGISRRMLSCHEHNEVRRIPFLMGSLREGKDVALVSDAGSPGVSDPGYRLVQEAIRERIPVTALPGPSALLLALCLSGLSPDRFTFCGFLPRAREAARKSLSEVSACRHTLIFFESPHRLAATLELLLEVLGDRQAALCRELTKRFETIERAALSALLESTRTEPPLGEYCIVVAGQPRDENREADREEHLRLALEELAAATGEPLKEAARRLAGKYGLSRREVYQAALEKRQKPGGGATGAE